MFPSPFPDTGNCTALCTRALRSQKSLCTLLWIAHCPEDVGQCSLVCCKAHWTLDIGCPDTGNGRALCVLCHVTWNTCQCLATSSWRPTKWVSMAPKAMKVAKRPNAKKKAHTPAKSKAMQKNKANKRKVHKKPAQAQTHDSCSEMADVIEENQEEEQQQEQQEEHEGNCQKDEDETADKDETEIDHKQCYRFGKSLPEASKAVQRNLNKLKDEVKNSAKKKQQLVDKAIALAMQKWGNKLFNSIDSLQRERCQAKGCDAKGYHGRQVWWKSSLRSGNLFGQLYYVTSCMFCFRCLFLAISTA